MIKEFYNDDLGYKAWLRDVGGYVYNDFGGGNVKYKKLHRSDCRMLHNVRPGQMKTSVRKICSSDLSELEQYISQKRGPEGVGYSRCVPCFPDASTCGPVGLAPQNSEHKAEYSLLLGKANNTQDQTRDLEQLAKAIGQRNVADVEIARIIDRPAERGHVGEYIAARIFGIALEQAASHKGIDGRFIGGSLAGKMVKIKWPWKRWREKGEKEVEKIAGEITKGIHSPWG